MIDSVDPIKGHKYIGVKFLPTKNISKIIEHNIEGRSHNWCKFYGWLEVNEETPIEIKLMVLDVCLYMCVLHAVEVMGDISCVEKKLRLAEQKALRAILKVKTGTSIDLLYNELKRADVISHVKDSQYKFFDKIKNLNEDEVVVKSIFKICEDTPIVRYYESLQENNKESNISQREHKIANAESSMLKYYSSLVNISEKATIYSSFVDDRYRAVITRWRLSNHKLRIETGRYRDIPREDRKCFICNVIEDEWHVIFNCPSFLYIRRNYLSLLEKYPTIIAFLNPRPNDIQGVCFMTSGI